MKKGARHGDLSFHPINELPKNLKKVEYKKDFVLAEGEHAGNKHKLLADPEIAEIYQDELGRYVLDIKQPTQITHEEHGVETFIPGYYIQEIEIEVDPFTEEIRMIEDD